MTSESIIHANLHKLNNKLVSSWLEHFWCTDKPQVNTYSQDSPQPELGGSHRPLYSILCAQPRGQHPYVILSQDSQIKSPKILEIMTFVILETPNFSCRSLIEMKSKAKLQPLLRSFQKYVTCHLHASKSGQFFIFSGFKLWPFF